MAKTIIFDMGGVLVHLDWDAVIGPLAKLSPLGVDAVTAEVRNGPIVRESMKGRLRPGEFHQKLCAGLLINLPFHEFVPIWNGLLSPNDDIVGMVESLKAEHPLALASNTDELHFAHSLKHYPVLQHFQRRFLSYEMSLLKPDPAYFRFVLDALQADAADCVFIDDTAENVEAARAAGMHGVVFVGVEALRGELEGGS